LRNVLHSIAPITGRLIYISSSSVYGQSGGEWVDESSECHPVQPGGQCCLRAEQLIAALAAGSLPLQANVLRLSGIYGPGRLLSRIESLRAGETLSGRGDAWLNLIHVEDAVAAVRACEERGRPGKTYLITDDLPVHRADYYSLLAALVGAPPPAFDPEVASRRGSGGLNKRCRNDRMRTELKVDLTCPTFNEGVPQSIGP
jgi:nucleoside-diphosphate-sugar epimerase